MVQWIMRTQRGGFQLDNVTSSLKRDCKKWVVIWETNTIHLFTHWWSSPIWPCFVGGEHHLCCQIKNSSNSRCKKQGPTLWFFFLHRVNGRFYLLDYQYRRINRLISSIIFKLRISSSLHQYTHTNLQLPISHPTYYLRLKKFHLLKLIHFLLHVLK